MRIGPRTNQRIGCVVFIAIAITFVVLLISAIKDDPIFQNLFQ